MTTEALHEFLHAKPFKPFYIDLADGQQVRVDHPEAIAHRAGGRTVVVLMKNDAPKIIDLLLVTSIAVEGDKRRNHRRRK